MNKAICLTIYSELSKTSSEFFCMVPTGIKRASRTCFKDGTPENGDLLAGANEGNCSVRILPLPQDKRKSGDE